MQNRRSGRQFSPNEGASFHSFKFENYFVLGRPLTVMALQFGYWGQGIRFIRTDPFGLKVYSHGSDADGAGGVGAVINIQVSGARISRGAFTDVVNKGAFKGSEREEWQAIHPQRRS